MPNLPYVPLRIQSSYSMLEGAVHPAQIAAICEKQGVPAAALVDRSVLFAAMEYSAVLSAKGVQPIIGAMVAVERPGGRAVGGRPILDWLVLLAQDETGYANLIHLVSEAHLSSDPTEVAHIDFDRMEDRTDGLICLTAGAEGALAQLIAEQQGAAADAYLDELAALFPERLYLEICRTGDPVEAASEKGLLDRAEARGLPIVATNPACFPEREFASAHDAMLCIAGSTYIDIKDRRRTNAECWLKPEAEMRRAFADLPEAIDNTAIVAQRCAVMAPQRKPILPSLAGDLEGEAAALREQARAGLKRRLERLPDADREAYFQRLDYELGIIETMGFPGYFLIVADFIKWAKENDIPVGPGRGSGAGSVVAWSLTITDLDPIQLGLLFERFLNPERVSMPDFDIDFCETRRGEVIRYVQQRYGRDQVAQIITFGKLKARAVLKDVGRVLQMPYGQIDRLAKMIDNNPANPQDLSTALQENVDLRRERTRDKDVDHLITLALKLEGMPRHSSTHAAGVVIGDRPLSQLVPLYRDPRSDMPVTQFDMKWVEQAGLVKFDFLGLKTLSVIQRALELIEETEGAAPDMSAIPWDDPDTYALMARGDTAGVFQLESEGMRRTLSLVKPDKFGDIIALVSLYRPGPMDNIPSYARRKHGQEKPDYLHPRLEQYLTETYGVIIYQEQVMQIAQELAGYSLGEADLLRRAMGKKKPEEMAKQKERFMTGAAEQGVDPGQADHIFELVAKFAGYGFNKSHAAAYALVAYQTAWLKAHYPTEFYAASMQFDMSLTDKLGMFLEDARKSGIACLPPDINASTEKFTVERTEDGKAVRYALAALKGVGTKAMQGVAEEREKAGPYKSLSDFANRVDPKLLNKRQIETLASAGAFDALEANRAAVHAMAGSILAAAAAAAEARITQQGALFGGGGAGGGEISLMRATNVERWSLADIMAGERDAFGFYFASHPLSAWQHVLDARGARSFARCCELGGPPGGGREQVTLGALVEGMRWQTPQKGGDKYLLATMSDETGQFMVSAFDSEVQESIQEAASEGEPMLLSAELRWSPGEDTPRVSARGVLKLKDLAAGGRARLAITAEESALQPLKTLFEAAPGQGCVTLHIRLLSGGVAVLDLGENVAVDSELAHQAGGVHGVASVSLSA
ncbi:DNA polymerase III subunit alpha [Pacificimonas flava]|uniref:DNA polymerase III subunit alpha n=1 Tax=Pacificimonas flava TaxID=1234595 RepID=M2SGS4_9SPHN|nr:DNA polymerase III subunit alpha [Pacificimonas flava]EMD84575.1 DNA polymerase III alpha subunit [Pacificimonas flava]MBB5279555.1 DNA polymerase-3 subunit alpha [Pacificimonas flava]